MRERRERGRKLSLVKQEKKKNRWRKDKGKRDRERRKRKNKKTKRKNKEGKEERKERECVIRERGKKKREWHFLSRSPTNRLSKCVGARNKVDPRDESYAWVPEITGFVAFQKVGVSPTLVISYLVAM